jgi:hypothetical protein
MTDASEEPSRGLMQAFFTPTNRGHDMILSRRRQEGAMPMFVSECELVPDVLNTSGSGMTWESFCRFLWSKEIIWLTPETYVTPQNRDNRIPPISLWNVCAIGTPIRDRAHVTYLYPEEIEDADVLAGFAFSVTVHALEVAAATLACDFLLGLLARSQQQYIHIGYCTDGGTYTPFPIAGPTLSNFLQQIHNRKVTLAGIILEEDQCHALATVSSPDLEITLERCTLVLGDTGCQDAFIECLQCDKGPTELDRCLFSSYILTTALTGNTRVVKLRICGKNIWGNAEMGSLFRSLTEMRGLVDLNLYQLSIIADNWQILCESLKMHRNLISLDLCRTHQWSAPPMTDEQKLHRTRALAEMLEVNTVLHTIKLSPFQFDKKIFTESVNPRLETNRYGPRVLAIKQADDRFRRALLGRALQSELVRYKSNILWMFLSGNADIVVHETTEG